MRKGGLQVSIPSPEDVSLVSSRLRRSKNSRTD